MGASCQQEDSTVLAVSSTNQSALMRGDAPDCSGEGVHTAEVVQAQVFPLLLPSRPVPGRPVRPAQRTSPPSQVLLNSHPHLPNQSLQPAFSSVGVSGHTLLALMVIN